jgi:hypothetical protein
LLTLCQIRPRRRTLRAGRPKGLPSAH